MNIQCGVLGVVRDLWAAKDFFFFILKFKCNTEILERIDRVVSKNNFPRHNFIYDPVLIIRRRIFKYLHRFLKAKIVNSGMTIQLPLR